MSKLNTFNVRVSGTDFTVDTSVSTGGGVDWASWTESLTLTQWQTNTGLTALQYLNPQDSSSVTLGVPDIADIVNDKTPNAHNVDFSIGARLVNLITTNGVAADVSTGLNTTVLSNLTGNSWSNPYILAYCFQISRAPTATETLYCHGSSSADVFAAISLTTNRYIEYSYKDDSGNTLTKTSNNAVPYDKKMLLIAFLERSKVRIFLHGDTFDHAIQITDEGAFNTTSTLNTQAINCKYSNGSASQLRTNGYYFGHILAEGVSTKTYDIIDNCCNLFGVPFALQDISTLDDGLISLIQGPGAGGLTTTKADVVDLINGTVFTATGTQPAATTGKFHNAMGLAMTASTVYMKSTVPAIWDIYSGSYGDYTIYVRHKTGTVDTSTRNVFCLNTTGAPTTQNFRLQQVQVSTVQTWTVNIDNSNKANSTVAVSSDTWYDFVIKCSSGVHTFSVNGETPITFTPGTRSTVGGYFSLGAMMTAASTIQHAGRGHLDCLALWNRALTSDEIIQLRNGGTGRDGMFNYLTAAETGGGSSVSEYRGTQLGSNTRNNVYCCGSTATGSGATYLSFKAPRSGRLRGVTVYWKSDTPGGYSAGTGGTYTLSVRTDSAGVPSATVVSEITGISGFSLNATTSTDYKTHTFTTAGMITAGSYYHMAIINTHANPASNWVCINSSDLYPTGNKAIVMPTRNNDTDWAIRLGYGKNRSTLYNNYTTYKGALNVTFHLDTDDSGTSDFWFGHPNSGQWSGNSRAQTTAFGGTNWLRQGLPIVSGDNFTITAVNVALTKVGSAGDVTATIRNNAMSVLSTVTISESNFPATTISSTSQPSWGRGVLSSPLAITGGSTYYLVLSSPSSSYYPVVLDDAVAYGAPSGTSGVIGGWYGTSGKVEASSNSGSTWGTYMDGKTDLGFYFEVLV